MQTNGFAQNVANPSPKLHQPSFPNSNSPAVRDLIVKILSAQGTLKSCLGECPPFLSTRNGSGEGRSMTRVTDFHCVNEQGEDVLCDAFGNNVAFDCPKCGHPMLAIILPKQNRHGSTPENPAICRHCKSRVWVVAEPAKQVLRLQSLMGL